MKRSSTQRRLRPKYEELSSGLGVRFLDDFKATLARLDAAPPEQPPFLASGLPLGVRQALFNTFKFRLVFVTEPNVIVVAVQAQREKPDSWAARLPK